MVCSAKLQRGEVFQPDETSRPPSAKIMRYFFDCEFIEDGKTIDLISIGIVSEDLRELYLQNTECNFQNAGDWVWRNVFPHLTHFSMQGLRDCNLRGGSDEFGCIAKNCPWENRQTIADHICRFMDIAQYGKPEIWGYYADYDWVAFCQLFGPMVRLPKGFPMWCRDIKQLCVSLGDPKLPDSGIHHALNDAKHVKAMYDYLCMLSKSGAEVST